MKSLNPMFNRRTSQKKPPQNPQKPNITSTPRKKRSDAKNDIKIPLSLEQRQILKKLAKTRGLSMTTYCSEVLALYLRRKTEYRRVEYSPTDKKSVHAKLHQPDYDVLFEYSVKWDCSLRQAAHRIITTVLKVESGGLENEKF
ncbi:hypothetical protein [Robertmurraya massiliosenegalensis]|uniref:hypothetical protein n=1 Tax=Robertmurraya massiliosenegalensis TaxID=1287657 RepID=UPI000366CDBE|nr:hypothetical protein [Robertmurraya massiliosenegalensis]